MFWCREHNMIRFVDGVPKAVWYSQHGNGQAFDYKALKKDSKTGKRVSPPLPSFHAPLALLLPSNTLPSPLSLQKNAVINQFTSN